MNLVKTGKAFGAEWDTACERENKARQKMHRVLHSPLVPRVERNPGANQLHRDGLVVVSKRESK
jgi:hypothetical protein